MKEAPKAMPDVEMVATICAERILKMETESARLRSLLEEAEKALVSAKRKIDGELCVPFVSRDCEGNQYPMEHSQIRYIAHGIAIEIECALAKLRAEKGK